LGEFREEGRGARRGLRGETGVHCASHKKVPQGNSGSPEVEQTEDLQSFTDQERTGGKNSNEEIGEGKTGVTWEKQMAKS